MCQMTLPSTAAPEEHNEEEELRKQQYDDYFAELDRWEKFKKGELLLDYGEKLLSVEGMLDALIEEYLPRKTHVLERVELEVHDEFLVSEDEEDIFYDGLERIGQALGGLQSLESIKFKDNFHAASIVLKHTRQILQLTLSSNPSAAQVVVDSEDDDDDEEEEIMQDLAAALEEHPTLETIIIEYLAQDVDETLQTAILTLPNLAKVVVDTAEDRTPFFQPEFLVELLTQIPTLTTLQLRNGTIAFDQVDSICEALACCSGSVGNVESLELLHCKLPATTFSNALAEALRHNTCLRALHLHASPSQHIVLGNSGRRVGKALGKHPTLEHLDLACPKRPAGPEESLAWLELVRGLSSSKSLRCLRLTDFDWTQDLCSALQQTLQQNKKITKLDIEGLKPNDAWLTILPCIAFNESLTTVRLAGCFDGGFPAQAVLNTLRSLLQASKLKHVTLFFYQAEWPAKAVLDFLQSLQHETQLQTFQCNMASASPETARAIVEAVKQTPSLCHLSKVFGEPLLLRDGGMSDSYTALGGDDEEEILQAMLDEVLEARRRPEEEEDGVSSSHEEEEEEPTESEYEEEPSESDHGAAAAASFDTIGASLRSETDAATAEDELDARLLAERLAAIRDEESEVLEETSEYDDEEYDSEEEDAYDED